MSPRHQSHNNSADAVHVINLNGISPPALDFEFSPIEATAVIEAAGLSRGRCFGSKSGYGRCNPRNFFVPNANLFTEKHGKVWWGDLDIVKDAGMLEQAGDRVGGILYVLRESDGRFENAGQTFNEVRRRAIWHTGGKTLPDQALIRQSGLTLMRLSQLVGVPKTRITTPQNPYITLQLDRRLEALSEVLIPIANEAGCATWGEWMLTPLPALAGRTPFAVWCSGETLMVEKIAPDMDQTVVMISALALTGTSVLLQWPPNRPR